MKFKKLFSVVLTLALLLSVAGCTELGGGNSGGSGSTGPAKSQSELFDEALMGDFRELLGESMLDVHFLLRYPENYDLADAPNIVGDIDFEALDNPKAELQESVDELAAVKRSELTDELKLIYDLLQYENELAETSLDFSYYKENLSPLLGQQSQLPAILAEYRLDTVEDAYDYVELVGAIPDYFTDLMEYQRRRSEKGLFMSDATADKTIASCESFIKNPAENQLIVTFETRLDEMGDKVTAAQKTELLAAATTAVADKVVPAYQSMIDGLTALKGTGKNAGGLCNLPSGKEYYAYRIQNDIGTERDVGEVIELIEDTLEQEITQMIIINKTDTTAFDRFVDYSGGITDPDEVLMLLRERCKTIMPALSELEYTVKYVHPSMEEHSSPAFYFVPPIDESVNSIYINRASMDSYTTLFSLLGHEGYPGHMYQNNYFLQQDPHPIRALLSYKGYSEGWASYVEELCYGMAGIDDSAVERLMSIDNNIGLLVSARVDIGVNYEGWDEEQVATYLTEWGLNAQAAPSIYSAVIEEPANYPAYCIGYLEFRELRQYAEEKLGESFDPIGYHKAILDLGEVPFTFVRKAVEQYIYDVKNSELQSMSSSLAAA